MSVADRAYALLLRAYPADFRARFGREMALCFRDHRRAGQANGLSFWLEIVWDVARTAPSLRLESRRARGRMNLDSWRRTMKTMAVLAILVGLIQVGTAVTWGRWASVACIAAVVIIRFTQPWMSVFAMLLGVAFPLAMLVFLQLRGSGGRSSPSMA